MDKRKNVCRLICILVAIFSGSWALEAMAKQNDEPAFESWFFAPPDLPFVPLELMNKLTALTYGGFVNPDNFDYVRILLDFGLDPNVDVEGPGWTLLHRAAQHNQRDLVDALFEDDRLDPNIADEDGRTALHYALHQGYHAILRKIVDHPRCDVNIQDRFGLTALHYAAIENNLTALRILLSLNDTNIYLKGNGGRTAKDFAVEAGNPEAEALLIARERLLNAHHFSQKGDEVIPETGAKSTIMTVINLSANETEEANPRRIASS